ncbi:GntR family transcriptional regulator [Halomonas piscis]|uniref:GntR family transcriptional regulator n=1 Tax=Halomonas piscis TaxID=3031727 RepID=UPI00289D6A58|nr:GntR family transcriptional regulator [Halomonas piscis]
MITQLIDKKPNFEATDVSQTASASSIVFDALRKAIIEGDLPDGTPLRQEELARMFNTSRIPVREAISRLEQQGLVATQRYKGAVVSGISTDEVDDIFDLRALIEGEVIKRAVPVMSAETIQAARSFCDQFTASSSPSEWGDINRNFHCKLYEAAGLPNHMNMINSILDRIDRYLRAQLALTEGMERASIEHEKILQACIDGESDLAKELTKRHIEGAKISLINLLQNRIKE